VFEFAKKKNFGCLVVLKNPGEYAWRFMYKEKLLRKVWAVVKSCGLVIVDFETVGFD